MRHWLAPQVRVGGIWLSSVAPWGDLVVTHRWPLGCWETTFALAGVSGLRKRPPALVAGATVEVWVGLARVWVGVLTQPDWSDGSFVAQGDCRTVDEASVPALTSAGLTTSIPDVAIDNAIARGWWPVTRPASLSATAYSSTYTSGGDDTDEVNSIGQLLDAWSVEANVRWAVNADRQVYAAPDPTDAAWDITTDTQALGVTQESLASTLVARWQDSTGVLHTRIRGTGAPVVTITLVPVGGLTQARVDSILDGILAQTRQSIGWTNALTVTPSQVSHGGVSPHPGIVRAGQRFRLMGQRDPRGPGFDAVSDLGQTLSVVCGESIWTETEGTLTLSPVGTTGKTLEDIVEQVGGQVVGS